MGAQRTWRSGTVGTFQAVFFGDYFENMLCFLQQDSCDTHVGGTLGLCDCKGRDQHHLVSVMLGGHGQPAGAGGVPEGQGRAAENLASHSVPVTGRLRRGLTRGLLEGLWPWGCGKDSRARRAVCPAVPRARALGHGQVSRGLATPTPHIFPCASELWPAWDPLGPRHRLPRCERAELPLRATGSSPDPCPAQ